MQAQTWAELMIAAFGVVAAGLTAWAARVTVRGRSAVAVGHVSREPAEGAAARAGAHRGGDQPVRREAGDER